MNDRKKEVGMGSDPEIDEELIELEQKLGFKLDNYDVEFPSETQITMTIDAIRPYVPTKANLWQAGFESMLSLLNHTLRETLHLSPLFWIANSVFFVLCLVGVWVADYNPYVMMLLLAPIPTITGLLEVLKSRNAGLAELELSFKYNLQQIILTKMAVVGAFNLLLNVAFTICISSFLPNVWVWKLILYWATPFNLITAACLMLVSRFRTVYPVTFGLAVWIAFSSLIGKAQLLEKIESVPASVYMILTIAALIVIINRTAQIYKRGVSFELNR